MPNCTAAVRTARTIFRASGLLHSPTSGDWGLLKCSVYDDAMTGAPLTWTSMTPSERRARWALNARDRREFIAGTCIQVGAPIGAAAAGGFYGWKGIAIAMACFMLALIAHSVWRKHRQPC